MICADNSDILSLHECYTKGMHTYMILSVDDGKSEKRKTKTKDLNNVHAL